MKRNAVSEYLAEIGAKGGAIGGLKRGKAKRRAPEFYAELSAAGVKARQRKARERKRAEKASD